MSQWGGAVRFVWWERRRRQGLPFWIGGRLAGPNQATFFIRRQLGASRGSSLVLSVSLVFARAEHG